ncbi:uncharacterized protein [Drosophila bipectinata]|uniref:uncharacterized protein n=1 Tax=Drosophila bipectinata TaxID=42026 RepID=UPI001C8973BD|nr:uncharacterized protein LOC108127434 [Drosophila bipectinata]
MIAKLKRELLEKYHYPPKKSPPKVKYVACGKRAFYHADPDNYTPCWSHPINAPAQARFGVCWEYPPERYKRRPLPPPCRGATLPLEVLKPTFEHCKNIYTRYDAQLEKCVHEQTLVLDKQLSRLRYQLAKAKEQQIEKVKMMRYHGVRYRLLIGGSFGTKIYPEYISRMTEERALCQFQRAYNFVNQSIADLTSSFLQVRESMKELELRLSRLDRSLNSPFLIELETVLQTLEDLNSFFFGVIVKLKTWAELMDPMKEHSIEDYLALLCTESNFKTFMSAGMENCTCKRCGKKDPLKPYLPCWCQPLESSDDCRGAKQPDPGCMQITNFKISESDSDFVPESSVTSLLVKAAEKKAKKAQTDQSD